MRMMSKGRYVKEDKEREKCGWVGGSSKFFMDCCGDGGLWKVSPLVSY